MVRATPDARVLVIDDDRGVCDVINSILIKAGLSVTTASTAWAALDIFGKNEFDLVVVADMNFREGLTGLEMVRHARIRQPSLKSLFISKYSTPLTNDPRDSFIVKPFPCGEVLGCVWELLCRALPKKQELSHPSGIAEWAILEAKIDCRRHGSQTDHARTNATAIP